MAEDGYNRNSIIGGYKGAPIKQSMLGKNLKTRGALSNNLPFRLANSLAPGNEYQFLFPTGTEAGAVWRFSQSGGQQQNAGSALGPGTIAVTTVGQAIGIQQDSRLPPVAHSTNLNSRPWTFVSGAANTIQIAGDTLTFLNTPNTDSISYNGEFPVAEWGRLEMVLEINAPAAVSNQFYFFLGNGGNLLSTVAGKAIYVLQAVGSVNGLLNFGAFNTVPGIATVRVLSITGYPGNHLSQATSTSRPLTAIETVGQWGQSVYSGRFDGVDDGESTPAFVAGTLTNNMDLFVAIKRTTTGTHAVCIMSPATNYICVINELDASVNIIINAGLAWTVLVDGVSLGGNGVCTRGALAAAIGTGQWHVLEVRNLDLSAWTQFGVDGYSTAMLPGNYGDVILCPAQSAANRALARTLVGASVGLLL